MIMTFTAFDWILYTGLNILRAGIFIQLPASQRKELSKLTNTSSNHLPRQIVPKDTAIMSHFIGPNMYLIESAIKDRLYLNLDGGNKADGTNVMTRYDPVEVIWWRLSVAKAKCAVRNTREDDTSSH